MKEKIDEVRRNLHDTIPGQIRANMTAAFEKAAEERGRGMKARMLETSGDEPGDGRTVRVRTGAEERDAGRVFRETSQCVSTQCPASRLRGHVGTVPTKPTTVGTPVPDHLRQVSHSAACQPSGGRSAAG